MRNRRALIAAGLMLSVSAIAAIREPRRKLAAIKPPLRLAEAIPSRFGAWRVDSETIPLLASPDVEAQMDRIYSQTFTRSYRNDDGDRIMLVIAYGEDQADSTTKLHLPEWCYLSQGFEVAVRPPGAIAWDGGTLPVVRLYARRGERIEPITYWTTVDNRVLNTESARKLARARFALAGEIPDGMLVRVSSLDDDETRAFRLQEQFAASMVAAMAAPVRERVFGRATS